MMRVALTGGVGSGKSTAAAVFRELGCFVSQSDEVARKMMQPGEAVYQSIVEEFGPEVLQPDGRLNRAVLAQLAFSEGRADDLNRIVHPPVIAWQGEWMRRLAVEHPEGIAMVESALIFETRYGESREGEDANEGAASGGSQSGSQSGRAGTMDASWHSRFDRIVLITAPQALRLERYIARAGASTNDERAAAEADARARMQMQIADEDKLLWADIVIANSGSLESLRKRVTQVWQELCAVAGDQPARARS